MRKTQRLTAVFGLCFGIIGNAMGAGYEMQPIIITASRVGENPGDMTRKVDVITHNDLETSAARDLSDVLTKLTSVNISHYGGVAGTKNVRMRGGTAQQVLVMVDGRPINNPRDGSVDLNTVPLDNVDRIEVLHGPASSLYGSQAMGGAVNVITKTPLPGKPVTEISTRYGSFSNSLHRLSHGAQISRFGYQINGELAGTRGFREHGGYKSQDLNGKWTYDLAARHKISLNLGANGDRADLPGEITAVDLDDEQRSVKNFADLAWNAELNDRIGVSARVYDNFDRLEFRENTAGALWDTAYEKTVHRTWVQGIDGNLRSRPFDADTVMVGVTFQRNKNESMRTGTHDYSVRAGYLENHLELFDRLKLSGSVRVDDYSTFGSKTNPSAGFLFKFTPRYRFRGLYSRSFRAPTFNDLYWPDTGWTKGNPNVRPEKGATKEVGIDNDLTDDLSVSATYFRNDFKDLINWAPDGAVWTPSNVDAAEMDGLETDGNLTFARYFSVGAGYTRLRAVDKNSGKYLIYQPKNKYNLSFGGKDIRGFSFELDGQYVGHRFHDPENTTQVKDFFVVGLHLAQRFKQGLTCFLSLDNLLDEDYAFQRNYPMPGTTVSGGMKLLF